MYITYTYIIIYTFILLSYDMIFPPALSPGVCFQLESMPKEITAS